MDAHMRRRSTTPAGTWRRLEARLNMLRWHSRLLPEEVAIRSETNVPTYDLMEVTPAEAARFLRAQWRMPTGPVRSLAQWMEAAGCLLVSEDFETRRVDGLSQWTGAHPVILVDARLPTDRLRWTLAHELGHLVLHGDVTPADDVEAQANAFAGELLLPETSIRPMLRQLNLGRLLDLKAEYGVSMQAILERAHHLGLLATESRTRLYKQLSARGWRTAEPGSDTLPPERLTLTASIGEGLSAQGLSHSEVARIAGFSETGLNTVFQPSRLRVV